MKRIGALILAMMGCGAPPLPAPPVSTPPPPPAPPALHFVEVQEGRESVLLARDPADATVSRLPLCDAGRWVATPKGEAFAIVRRKSGGSELYSLSAAGEQRIVAGSRHHCPAIEIIDGRVVVTGTSGSIRARTELSLLVASLEGEVLLDAGVAEMTDRSSVAIGPRGAVAVPLGAGGAQLFTLGRSQERSIDAHATHAPAGDRGLMSVATTAVGFFGDGTLVTGAGDGTVSAFDDEGRRLWSFGLRGAIRGLTRVGERLLAITTAAGTAALADRDGKLRWERRLSPHELGPPAITDNELILAGERSGIHALSLAGEVVFSHDAGLHELGDEQNDPPVSIAVRGDEITAPASADRRGKGTLRFRLGDSHPPVPSRTPIHPLRFERQLNERVRSLLVLGRDDVWVLADGPPPGKVFHYDGRSFTRVSAPARDARKEQFLLPTGRGMLEKIGPKQANYLFDSLAQAPDGKPWILGRRVHKDIETEYNQLGAGLVLEWDGKAFRERRDLFDAFSQVVIVQPIAPVATGPAKLVCFGASGDGGPKCLEHEKGAFHPIDAPARITSAATTAVIGGTSWLLEYTGGPLYRRAARAWEEVAEARDLGIHSLAATGERDVWAFGAWNRVMHHFDGSVWTWRSLPLTQVRRVYPAAPDDVWVTGGDLVHYDGRAWSRVAGLPGDAEHIGGAGRDIWVSAGGGLWHGVPGGVEAPSLRLPAAKSIDGGAPPAAAPLPLGATEDRYRVERATIPIDGKPALDAALGVSGTSEGVTWINAWDRLVEVDESTLRGRVLRAGYFGSCRRCAAPEKRGRGVVIAGGALHRIDGSSFTREAAPIAGFDAVSAAGGASWAAGMVDDDEAPRVLARTPRGLIPVLGLPAADWVDVSIAGDGVFLAGARSSSSDGVRAWPAGEGLLVHHRAGVVRSARAAASLLAVAAIGPDEAWAVGAAGTIVHDEAGRLTRFSLASGEWLRAVWGSGPDDVWMGGDGGTLIHYDGREFRRVAVTAIASDASISGIGGARDRVWVVSPSGILRVTRR